MCACVCAHMYACLHTHVPSPRQPHSSLCERSKVLALPQAFVSVSEINEEQHMSSHLEHGVVESNMNCWSTDLGARSVAEGGCGVRGGHNWGSSC